MKLITTEELAEKLQVDTVTVFRLEKQEAKFPRAIRISKKTIRWDENEIDDWLKTRKEVNNENSRTR